MHSITLQNYIAVKAFSREVKAFIKLFTVSSALILNATCSGTNISKSIEELVHIINVEADTTFYRFT